MKLEFKGKASHSNFIIVQINEIPTIIILVFNYEMNFFYLIDPAKPTTLSKVQLDAVMF